MKDERPLQEKALSSLAWAPTVGSHSWNAEPSLGMTFRLEVPQQQTKLGCHPGRISDPGSIGHLGLLVGSVDPGSGAGVTHDVCDRDS